MAALLAALSVLFGDLLSGVCEVVLGGSIRGGCQLLLGDLWSGVM